MSIFMTGIPEEKRETKRNRYTCGKRRHHCRRALCNLCRQWRNNWNKTHCHIKYIFAEGSLNAAVFLHDKQPGMYTMDDLIKNK